jgi:hypothetical protein
MLVLTFNGRGAGVLLLAIARPKGCCIAKSTLDFHHRFYRFRAVDVFVLANTFSRLALHMLL